MEPLKPFPVFDRKTMKLDMIDRGTEDPLVAPTIQYSELMQFAMANLQFTPEEMAVCAIGLSEAMAKMANKPFGEGLFTFYVQGVFDGVRMMMAQTRTDLATPKERVM